MASVSEKIRAEAERPIEILRSATLVNARILKREGRPGEEVQGALGELAPGACADLIVVEGDPLQDLNLLQNQGEHIPVIMKAGKFYKNLLVS